MISNISVFNLSTFGGMKMPVQRIRSLFGPSDCRRSSDRAARRGLGCKWILSLLTFFAVAISVQGLTLNDSAQGAMSLDMEIYLSAFRSLSSVRPRILTGTVYNVSLGNITDQSVELVQIVRLRSGSLKRYGFQFNEITFPKGVEVNQSLSRVVLVYRRFKRSPFYDATSGKSFVSPVVGVQVFNGDNLTVVTNFSRAALTLRALPADPLVVQLLPSSNNSVICASYNNTDYANFTTAGVANLTSSGTCLWTVLGDFSLLGIGPKKANNALKIGLGVGIGSAFLILLLLIAICLCVRYRQRRKFADMESKAEQGDTLNNVFVGSSRAPSAPGTRTKPVLENDYAS